MLTCERLTAALSQTKCQYNIPKIILQGLAMCLWFLIVNHGDSVAFFSRFSGITIFYKKKPFVTIDFFDIIAWYIITYFGATRDFSAISYLYIF